VATDPAHLSLREQLRTVRESRVLVAFHGAALTHLLFMHPESSVLELTAGRFWIRNNFLTMSRNIGRTFMQHSLDQGAEQKMDQFFVKPSELISLLAWHAPLE
jgi:capsular polysaccharide biosynthesis protein